MMPEVPNRETRCISAQHTQYQHFHKQQVLLTIKALDYLHLTDHGSLLLKPTWETDYIKKGIPDKIAPSLQKSPTL